MADSVAKRPWYPTVVAGAVGLVIGAVVALMVAGIGGGHDRADAPAPTTVTVTQQAPEKECGPAQQAALEAAFAQLIPEPLTGRDWSGIPKGSNYDPCAELSTILVTVLGGTGSSPTQALMFHRGEYVGPATPTAYGSTGLDATASTDDTVVLTYRTGQSCTACGDGTLTAVRYRWSGDGVQRLDPLPPHS